MNTVKLALLGFGNVHRAFVALLHEKADRIQQDFDLKFLVVGIATHSHGIAINPSGINLEKAFAADDLGTLHQAGPIHSTEAFIEAVPADIIFEGTWANPKDGQPATDYVRLALQSGKHVVTANKGPVAFAYKELKSLADEQNLGFLFESTIMDGVPVHLIARDGLHAADILGIRGVLNSTTNAILTRMEEGETFDDALKEMQEAGTAEANPSHDIDGWDAALKIVLLANVLMDADLRPTDLVPVGIRDVTPQDIQDAVEEGLTLKLVAEVRYDENDELVATVHPERVDPYDPLAWLDHSANAITIETDIIDAITITESPADPRATAYGMLVDAINIAQGRF